MYKFNYQMNYDEQTCSVVSYTGDEPEIEIPEQFCGRQVTILLDNLFAGHPELRSVRFPDSITDFGEFLFDGCTELRKICLPADLRFLWGYTFARCGLDEIVIPDGVSRIPPYAFKDCTNLQKVVCGVGMKKIDAWAFSGCAQLTEVVYHSNVDVSPDAFGSNESILRISY